MKTVNGCKIDKYKALKTGGGCGEVRTGTTSVFTMWDDDGVALFVDSDKECVLSDYNLVKEKAKNVFIVLTYNKELDSYFTLAYTDIATAELIVRNSREDEKAKLITVALGE